MNIETATDHLCRRFLRALDPQANGAVVEVGLGSCNFSFEWAAPLGHRCVAVEPLPTPALKTAVAKHGVRLFQIALSDQEGERPIFHGVLNGFDLPDISSLNPRWWGVAQNHSMVPVNTLSWLLEESGLKLISLLKVDTEGSEGQILASLSLLPEALHPTILIVEYGGGGTHREGTGGWAPEFQIRLIETLEMLRSQGYVATLVLDAGNILPRLVEGATAFTSDALFQPESQVGNLLVFHQRAPIALVKRELRQSRVALFQSSVLDHLGSKTWRIRHLWQKAVRRIGA